MAPKTLTIPPQFWGTLTPAEFSQICEDNGLNAAMCKRLWAMQGRVDKPPDHLEVWVKKAELDRWLATKPKL